MAMTAHLSAIWRIALGAVQDHEESYLEKAAARTRLVIRGLFEGHLLRLHLNVCTGSPCICVFGLPL